MTLAAEGLERATPSTAPAPMELSLDRAPAEPDIYGVTLFWENDGAWSKFLEPTDAWYTAGLGIAVQSQGAFADRVVSRLPSVNGEFSPERDNTSYSLGLLLAMDIYTPEEIDDPEIREDDRPYAGWSYLGLMAQRANRSGTVPVFEHFELDLGILGETSGAEDVQKWAHEVFEGAFPEGWDHQVHDEFGADFRYQRRWRIEVIPAARQGPAMQLIPDAGFTLGTVHTHAAAGATLRYGWKLPDDFGPGNLRVADDFTRPMDKSQGVTHGASGYFFARPGVRLVAHDATFGDSLFRDNVVSVDHQPVVGQITGGVVVSFLRHWRASYAYTLVSPEFKEQSSWHSFASIQLSAVFTW